MAKFNTDVNLSPDYGVSISHKPFQKVQRYADGYEHRLNFGIAAHQNPRTVNLQFNNITESESDTLINFLKAISPVFSDDIIWISSVSVFISNILNIVE